MKLVKINAKGINSRYGYIVERTFQGQAALIKVGIKADWQKFWCEPHCIMLGKELFEEI